jgi:hypothetical protein
VTEPTHQNAPECTTPAPTDVRVRPHTTSMERYPLRTLREGTAELPPSINAEHPRPRTWGECQSERLGTRENPCPFVSCTHHLALDVTETGAIREAFPGRDVDEIPHTCALAFVEEYPDGAELQLVGDATGVCRERVRQIEVVALRRAARRIDKEPPPPPVSKPIPEPPADGATPERDAAMRNALAAMFGGGES